jgi:plastocyanin
MVRAALHFTGVILAALAAGDARAAGSDLSGTIELIPPAGRPASPAGTVVWLPDVRVSAAPAAAPEVASQGKRFEPRVLVVTRGTTVAFPNADRVYHNAFSLSPGNTFDLGLYHRGASRSATFETPGVVRVYCNIHPDMAAFVVVVEGDAYAIVGGDGAYRIAGVPPGRHAVKLWNEMTGEQTASHDFAAGKTVRWDVTLDASRYQPPVHKNKHGRPYPPATQDDDRY